MKYKLLRPEKPLKTSVVLPASKSISNRLLVIHALSGNESAIENLSDSDDTILMQKALLSGDTTKDIGHAGTAMRFLTSYYSCRKGSVIMTGSDRMKERPIGPLVKALISLGADIQYIGREGFPPFGIKGKILDGGEIEIEGNISSQFISALLMVAPSFRRGLTLKLKGEIVSSSYINMTLSLMRQHGAMATWEDRTINIKSGSYRRERYRVESDWSAASYWYAMMLANQARGVDLNYLEQQSLQGDSDLVNIFGKLGIRSEFRDKTCYLAKEEITHPEFYDYDFTNSPDLVQSVAVILCLASVPFRFTGTQTLRIKETDRISALQDELKKLGFILTSDQQGSFLSWSGERCRPLRSPVINTYHDHRMAMAFAPAALFLEEIIIDDPMVVTKSYPRFWEDLRGAGFNIHQISD